ncbi:MAG: DUF4239 domain-containing protein [Proteobacteria bacterium]|nr:DUF4239 domain-containing protein [Pseudomonadota bacterium]
MERIFLNELTTWPFLFLSIFILIFLGILTFFITQRYLSHFITRQHEAFLMSLTHVLIISYGILMGFIIVTLWETFIHAKHLTIFEANHLALMTLDSAALPNAIQSKLLNGIGQYIQYLIQDEWPAMRWGHSSAQAEKEIVNLFHILQSYIPQNETETSFFREVLTHLNGVLENRRLRLEKLHSSLIEPLRFILFFGSLLILFFISLFKTKSKSTQLLFISTIGCIFGFNIGLVLLLDCPFAGDIAIDSNVYTQGILAQFK